MHVASIKLMGERFRHVVNATSDAIWDIDLLTNEIFRSDNFSSLSGYKKDEIEPTLEWWFNKIHPDDRPIVEDKLKDHLHAKKDYWESEYRFLYADGSYRLLNDRGFAIFEDGHPVRLIGAIKDITEKRELENKLIEEKVRRKELVNRASVQAQELERDRISKELHDNINQLLLSTKMYMSVIKSEYEDANGFLEKAIEYQMMGIEEIRKLSKELSSSVLDSIGLDDSLHGIEFNMQMAQQINVRYSAFEKMEEVLRIVQEQTSNIIKYARASAVDIVLSLHANIVMLEVKDNGVGFDMATKPAGIGLSNIHSRAKALKGDIKIESSPGKGCQLFLSFPLQ
ncbi:MAG: PAS domain-containing protein [Chitinophagaceae bacterium]|nr:PAS domain-containing protein [Chitinophagaceae bacterium]